MEHYMHEHSTAQPQFVQACLSTRMCRLECETGVGELFSGKRLEDGIA